LYYFSSCEVGGEYQQRIQISNIEGLQIIVKFWKKDYFGLPISQNLISEIWSDFIPVYHSGHLLRFNYVDESDEIQFTFLDVYSKTDLPPLKKSRLSNDFDDSTGFFQYFDDSEVF
jgi:hypothetical protein